MEKNVVVVDEQGNEYEATWPKRARGLVKSGRARFIEENKICLTCPPNIEMEGNQMSENSSKLTVNYLLERIEEVGHETEHIYAAIEAIKSIGPADVPGDESGSARAAALAEMVKSRETTNQQLINTYRLMFQTLVEGKVTL